MVRFLALAILLALVLPATGAARIHAQTASDLAIFVLFLLNGLRIERAAILGGLRNLRFLAPLFGWVFGGMALLGWGAAGVLGAVLPQEVALGFLFLGVLPSTVQSATSYTVLARGNAALSVIAAALLNVAGVFLAAPLFALAAGTEAAQLGNAAIARIALILVLPFLIGQALQGRARRWVIRHRDQAVWIDRFVIALAVYVAFSGAVEQDVWHRLTAGAWAVLLAALAVMLALAHGGAWLLSRGLGLARGDRIAFLFAGAQKSAAVGVPLGTLMFPVATAGFVLLPLLLYHLFQLVLAAPLAARLAR